LAGTNFFVKAIYARFRSALNFFLQKMSIFHSRLYFAITNLTCQSKQTYD